MDRQSVVNGTRAMGNTRFTPKGSMTKQARQVLFDDLIAFEREVIKGQYGIETYLTPIGLFLAHKNVNTWGELFDDVYQLKTTRGLSIARRAKEFLTSLEGARNLDEAIDFVASGYTDIELFRKGRNVT